ncbi:DUF960 domain-containing protein [Melissococcus plutonius]|uniref:GTP cyclohydrolase n=2 Tax=Melissococcus plutonius TaxID=33970 RepID=F3YC52_MELPT|nr:DUF960 domain-containing protein [Melissococcus plutonius]BAL61676.1 hypothetical protein MPD5_0401 [Melissococcus plutonius DAT561]AIM25325.1 hypothetical protein MEPL_c015150 [Melissococcus plutonius S1]KMT24023.1 hypothetical protein MEPL2_3c02370 [Melissococcus plutonius]KMT24177.1 hypothetical protein MEPL3_7c00460 [Melissococcus plutonius]KMT25522.1 hypothetical protein MEPL1_7c00460 [Melissococcus plutonius]
MFESFDSERSRYASLGVVVSLPEKLIDSIWLIIDLNLKGVVPLTNILYFDLINNNGKVTIHFSQEMSDVEMSIDLTFPYLEEYPAQVFAFDDGNKETIILPMEMLENS